MKIVQHGKKRKAISPVLATVILIAITLIAAIAVAGFVFGLFGTFTSSATVQAGAVACVQSTGICTLLLQNSGTSSASIQACSFSGAGGGAGAMTPAAGTLVPAGGKLAGVTCTIPLGMVVTAGEAVSGSVTLSNGGSALFAGTWQ